MSPYLRPVGGDPAEPRPRTPVQITVDGRTVHALPGQTVAAVLLAAGRESWRTTRTHGRPRGIFCGIGACFDCLVVVNGIPDVRACQRTIQPGDTITTQHGAVLPAARTRSVADPPAADSLPADPLSADPPAGAGPRREWDVVVVGAGPAGMGAALAAADRGVDVLLVDAGRALGGQFHRQLPEEFNARRPGRLHHGWNNFRQLGTRITRHPRITYLPDTTVWALEPNGDRHRLWLQTGPADSPGRRGTGVDVKALVLATGAFDRVVPFPGWDLPGVYSAGAAQALAKGQRISVGRRIVLAGTGPFLLPVAEALLGVGAEIAGLFEANHLSTVTRGWLTDPLVARGKLLEGAQYAARLARHRVPLRHGRTVVAAHGADRVEAVTIAKLTADWRPIPGTEEQIEVDAVCLGFGFTPNLELAVSARCRLTTGPDGGPAVLVDDRQETSTPGVFAAGELTGIGGADLAAAEGQLAGAAAAAKAAVAGDTGNRTAVSASAVTQAVRANVAKGKRFAAALARAYPVGPGWQQWSDSGTLVCRCEEVSRGELEQALSDRDATTSRSVKLTSRAGLGLCQGRVCSRTVADLAAARRPGVQADHHRPIAVPVRLDDLATIEEEL